MDIDLVRRAQAGDEQAFASLAVAAGNRLHAVAHRILRLAISPSIWRSASTYPSIWSRSWFASGVYRWTCCCRM
jgi:hypothetical protein